MQQSTDIFNDNRITKEMIMDILDKENVVIGSDLYTQIIVSVDKESNIGVLYVISLSCPFLLSQGYP